MRKRDAAEGRQENVAGRAHFPHDLAVLGLVSDEKIALKRRDARAKNGDSEGGQNEARRRAQPVDCTSVNY